MIVNNKSDLLTWLNKPGFLNFNIYDRIIENLNLAGKISKIPKYTNTNTNMRITNLIMKTGKKFASLILNVQSSLAFDPFTSRFFIGLLLFATFCSK